MGGVPKALPPIVLGLHEGALVYVQPIRWRLPVGRETKVLDGCSIEVSGIGPDHEWGSSWAFSPRSTVIDGVATFGWPTGANARVGAPWEAKLRRVTGPGVDCAGAVAAMRATMRFEKASADFVRERLEAYR